MDRYRDRDRDMDWGRDGDRDRDRDWVRDGDMDTDRDRDTNIDMNMDPTEIFADVSYSPGKFVPRGMIPHMS
jgi:Ni/Co efflux regulator RcnB